MSELKSCPFCGGMPTRKYLTNITPLFPKGAVYICCENENCAIQPMTDAYESKGMAARAWNRRHTDE